MKKCLIVTLTLLTFYLSIGSAKDPRTMALVPGLQIKRIPLELTNINSIAYGHDGRLYAAAYNGQVHVLTDTDGDGVEDRAQLYWNKPGDLLTPVGIVAAKEGIYLAVRGKIASLKDTDGDGIADQSTAVVSGWVKESYNSDRRNDASGIALDGEGNLYFSLGCMSYNKAWKLDKNGRSHYRKEDERGSILKVSPDRKNREIIATGLRFVIGMEFNQHGDLFATDQEGDTWFPGGNPRDELLHIVPDRHYGFPFRHPKYLPKAIDEPEVVGFSPQHQSTCGFRFNEKRDNRKPFGPPHWEGDAIVTGFSRGKLWRVPLAKTRAGYVGKQVQIAAFESLLTDVAISPEGSIAVTGHGGAPDWGSGPAAKGYLYKLIYQEKAPQPVASWSASPIEIKVAFDRAVTTEQLNRSKIEMGEFVWEGNDHEWIIPGYEVVKAEKQSVGRPLKVHNMRLSDDARTATFTTALQSWRARYKICLRGEASKLKHSQDDSPSIELSHDLGGVLAEWTRQGDSAPSWKGWLPHIDLNIVRTLTRGSSEHKKLLALLSHPGRLTLRSQLLLPGQEVTFQMQSNATFTAQFRGQSVTSKNGLAEISISAKNPHPVKTESRGGREMVLPSEELQIMLDIVTGNNSEEHLSFDISYHADFDPYERPLRLEHLFVPWAPATVPASASSAAKWTSAPIPGDPEKGRAIFLGKEGNCAICHTHSGQGKAVGPDLTSSVHRGPEAVMKDILEPSASINPEYVSYAVTKKDGTSYTGLFLSADDKEITLVDVAANQHSIQRNDIVDIRALPVSLMPAVFAALGKEKLQDLVAFLCSGDPGTRGTGGILREYWLDIPEGGLPALTEHSSFPDKPDGNEVMDRFEGPVNWKEYYGSRIRGFIHPPQTGNYIFALAADDHAQLRLSATEDHANSKPIITLNRWTPSRAWETYPEQKSKPIHLEAGKRYYIEALQVEARVDDCLAVGWHLPDGTEERPIPGHHLSPPDRKK